MNPNTIIGIPTIAPTTVMVKTSPTTIKTIPRIAPTRRPVRFKIPANNFHKATKGHARQEVDEFILLLSIGGSFRRRWLRWNRFRLT